MEKRPVSAHRLINETSPYLRQHAHNPVDWYAWGEEALQKARSEDKPIFLSIGYSACHWCHVMEKESFMDETVAGFLNHYFVSIKVDREERPDLDSIYMNAVVLMTGQGGWPLTVFLTPKLEPFFGGTYFPPVSKNGMISFIDLLKAISQAWVQDRENVQDNAHQVVAKLKSETMMSNQVGGPLQSDLVEKGRDALLDAYDWQNGGWGQAPKFPQPILLEFLCRQAWRGHELSRKVLMHALDAMCQGGMYDLVGGGFHRYSTDSHWLIPHFEKMLYDNAQLILVYLHAYLLTNKKNYARLCTESLDFILSEMTAPNKGFYSSLDADSRNGEGRFYLWTEPELKAVLTEAEFELLKLLYPYPSNGTIDGRIILRRNRDADQATGKMELSNAELSSNLEELLLKLRGVRNARPHPAVDTKVLTGWNGLALRAFAEAGRYLDRRDYLAVAQNNANFILTKLWKPEGLQRVWSEGHASHPAYLEDYGSLILGLLALYQADFNNRWLLSARSLADEMIDRMVDPTGGFFDANSDTDGLLFRPKELQDNATPSGNALAASALLMLEEFDGDPARSMDIEGFISGFQKWIGQYPASFGSWLQILDFISGPVYQIALVTHTGLAKPNELKTFLAKKYIPNSILAVGKQPVEKDAPELLRNRKAIDNRTTAYVCQNFKCNLPVTNLPDLMAQLP